MNVSFLHLSPLQRVLLPALRMVRSPIGAPPTSQLQVFFTSYYKPDIIVLCDITSKLRNCSIRVDWLIAVYIATTSFGQNNK